MSKAQYLIRLDDESMNKDGVVCTGKQTYKIISLLQKNYPRWVWFAADIHLVSGASKFFNRYKSSCPEKVGNYNTLAREVNKVIQFESGIILAVPDTIDNPDWKGRIFDTEGEQFDELGDAVLEIRFFDTTYFEIVSNNPEILQILKFEFTENIISMNQEDLRNEHKKK